MCIHIFILRYCGRLLSLWNLGSDSLFFIIFRFFSSLTRSLSLSLSLSAYCLPTSARASSPHDERTASSPSGETTPPGLAARSERATRRWRSSLPPQLRSSCTLPETHLLQSGTFLRNTTGVWWVGGRWSDIQCSHTSQQAVHLVHRGGVRGERGVRRRRRSLRRSTGEQAVLLDGTSFGDVERGGCDACVCIMQKTTISQTNETN